VSCKHAEIDEIQINNPPEMNRDERFCTLPGASFIMTRSNCVGPLMVTIIPSMT